MRKKTKRVSKRVSRKTCKTRKGGKKMQYGCCHKHHHHTKSCSQQGGQHSLPSALIGKPWIPHSPHGNHYVLNEYVNDIALQMKPSNSGFHGGKRKRKRKTYSQNHHKTHLKTRKNKGGGLITQDLVNLGQQFGHGVQSTYNTLRGIPPTPNPSPIVDQFPNHTQLRV